MIGAEELAYIFSYQTLSVDKIGNTTATIGVKLLTAY